MEGRHLTVKSVDYLRHGKKLRGSIRELYTYLGQMTDLAEADEIGQTELLLRHPYLPGDVQRQRNSCSTTVLANF